MGKNLRKPKGIRAMLIIVSMMLALALPLITWVKNTTLRQTGGGY